jgi:hypothetical protein
MLKDFFHGGWRLGIHDDINKKRKKGGGGGGVRR